jgi:hypothetical protein
LNDAVTTAPQSGQCLANVLFRFAGAIPAANSAVATGALQAAVIIAKIECE